ncbi:MAG: HIT domain-containing protein [Acidobacteriia bacterium]|nr:HIT domain-containing protein [Terriglobia bacterium]
MDRLWSPWRYQYVSKALPADDCIFCTKGAGAADAENFVVFRGRLNFVLLNIYPYTNGHIMIAPYAHVATLEEADEDTVVEMIQLARHWDGILRSVYKAPGINMGMNIGECAGAGVAGHIHMHMLPRWPADSNFMTTVAETRVLPEELASTFERLTSHI